MRDIIDPNRDLGHVDGKKKAISSTVETPTPEAIKATTGLASPIALAGPTAHAGPAAPEVSLRDFIATGVAIGDVSSSGRGGAEEEVLEHDELALEAQPGGGRYKRAAAETGNMEEEVGIKGVVCDTAYDEKKRNLDGTICEDCS